jgi:flagellar L-ring protein precursor FlgH
MKTKRSFRLHRPRRVTARRLFRLGRSALQGGLVASAVWATTSIAHGQDSSLARPGVHPPLTAEDIFGRPEPPKVVLENDQVTVVVNINTRLLSEGSAETRRQQQLNATLADWIQFQGLDLKPDAQSDGDPTVSGTLNQRVTNEAELDTRDSLSFTIRATITSIRPNGTMVIEAHRTIENNDEVWKHSLWGVIHRDAITADNTVLSKDIADLRIKKTESGEVRDGYRRGWLSKLYQKFQPF